MSGAGRGGGAGDAPVATAGAGAGAGAGEGTRDAPPPFEAFGSVVEVRPGREVFLVRIACEEAAAPTLFLVHGSCASYRQYENQIEALRDRFHIVAYDARGCGRMAADAPKGWYGYAENEMLEDLRAVFMRYKSDRNAVVGHSFGTVLVAKLAAAPDAQPHIGAVSLIGAAFDRPGGKTHPVFYLPCWVLNCLATKMSAAFKQLAYHPDTSEEMKDREGDKTKDNQMYMVKAFYRQVQWSVQESFGRIRAPTLVLTGEADQLTTPAQAAKVAAAMADGVATLEVVRGAGHMVMSEQPAALLAALTKLFQRARLLPATVTAVTDDDGAPAASPRGIELEVDGRA